MSSQPVNVAIHRPQAWRKANPPVGATRVAPQRTQAKVRCADAMKVAAVRVDDVCGLRCGKHDLPAVGRPDRPERPGCRVNSNPVLGRRVWIPNWYHVGMTKQIAVRLPDDLVEFVDEVVGSGKEPSRAAVVTTALERERRRAIAARDSEILDTTGPDPDLAGLAEFAAGVRSER
jgi:Arc/MetJ-type ribon-helix-helix transcriptional regulator